MQTSKLGLTIPDQTANNSDEDLSISAIEKWCTQLQTADTGETAHKLCDMLKKINAVIMPPKDRFQILELLRPLSISIYQLIKKIYTNRTQPLSAKKLELIELSKTLQLEMFNGCKIIIDDTTLDSEITTSTKTDLIQNAVYRAFKYCNNILSICYHLYIGQPENLWKDLNIIYQYANSCKITEYIITLETGENNKKLSVINPYKTALFLAALNPYQWRQSEQDLLYKYASIWEEFIIVRNFKARDHQETSGIFFIPLNEDSGPFAISTDKKTISEDGSILDFSKLIAHLNKNSTSIISSAETEVVKYSLQKLINYVVEGPKRNLERFNILGNVSATFGFLSTHYHINKKTNFDPENVDSSANVEEFQLNADTMLDAISMPGSNSDPTNNNEVEFKADTFLYKCNLINIHGEGAGITLQDIEFPPVQPGELVAMTIAISTETDLDETHWNIGTVRWLKHDLHNKLTAGVQILAPFAIAAAVQLLKKDGTNSGYFQRALLFQDNTQQTFTLVTPILQFESGKKVKIYSYYHKEFVETELKTQINSNSNFKFFVINIKFSTHQQ